MRKLEIGSNLMSALIAFAFMAAVAIIGIFGNDTKPQTAPQQQVQTTGAQK